MNHKTTSRAHTPDKADQDKIRTPDPDSLSG